MGFSNLDIIGVYASNALDFLRLENVSNLFYNEDVSEKIEVKTLNVNLETEFKNGRFLGKMSSMEKLLFRFSYDHLGKISHKDLPEKSQHPFFFSPLEFIRI